VTISHLDELYLVWLVSQFSNPTSRNLDRRYLDLSRKLYRTEFVWFVPNDDSRLNDGRDLRREFMLDAGIINYDQEWMDLGCSFLELMVALSRRLSFQIDGKPNRCFLLLLENIGLADFTDAHPFDEDEIEEITDRVIYRTYSYDGSGGFFPLKNAREDQRKVELWYQMSAYIIENDFY